MVDAKTGVSGAGRGGSESKFGYAEVNEDLWQVSFPQEVSGVPVRGGRLLATISHGNIVLLGTETWGNVHVDTSPTIAADEAVKIGETYWQRLEGDTIWRLAAALRERIEGRTLKEVRPEALGRLRGRVLEAVHAENGVRRPLVFAGFSQGGAMAYRAAARYPSDALIVLASDVPPDVLAATRASLPPDLLIFRPLAVT